MNRLKVRDTKKQAAALLKEQGSPFRKAAFYSYGIPMVYSILLAIISLFLTQSMEGSQGLDGLGTAAYLQTIEVFLTVVGNLLLPFWSMGLLYAAIRGVRRQDVGFSVLTRGFQRFGPILRYMLLYGLILFVLVILSINIVLVLAVCMPVPPALSAAIENLGAEEMMAMMGDPTATMTFMEQLPREALLQYYIPVMGILMVVFTGVFLFVNYRFCMARYLLLDETKIGAFASLFLSGRITKGDRWNLFKLDLSFWWYFLGLAVITIIPGIPQLLAALQVQLPVSDTVAAITAGVVGMAVELGWLLFFGPYYMFSQSCAYTKLAESLQTEE